MPIVIISCTGFSSNNILETKTNLKKPSHNVPNIQIANFPEIEDHSIHESGKNIILNKVLSSQGVAISYNSHSPIFIDGNFSITASNEHWNGSGIKSDPFIINGLNISNTGLPLNLIDIRNTDVYFQVNNCLLLGGDKGIYFHNVSHGTIKDNLIFDNSDGIIGYLSSNCTILGNTIYNNSGDGISLSESGNSTITDNVIYNNNFNGIRAYNSSCIVTDNTVYNNNLIGISILFSVNSSILGNIVHNNSNYGIYLSNSDNSTISGNIVYNNNELGVLLIFSENVVLWFNLVFENKIYGISIQFCGNSVISGNNVYNNTQKGIIIANSDNSTIVNNSVYNDNVVGISISFSFNITIVNNTVHNINQTGIQFYNSNSSNIAANSIYQNTWIGINLTSSPDCILSNNIVFNNGEHGFFLFSSNNCTILDNFIFNNSKHGIYFTGSDLISLSRNVIYYNYGCGVFLENSDNGTCSYNIFYSNSDHGFYASSSSDIIVVWNDFINNHNEQSTGIQHQAFINSSNTIFANNYWDDFISNNLDNQSYVIFVNGSQNIWDLSPLLSPNNPSPIHYITNPIILYPYGIVASNGSVEIQWKETIDSFKQVIAYSIYCSYNDGKTWIELETEIYQTNFIWELERDDNTSIVIFKVIATSTDGLTSSDISDPIQIFLYLPKTSFSIDIFKEVAIYILDNILFLSIFIGIVIVLILKRKRIIELLKQIWERGVVIVVLGASTAYKPVTRRINWEEVQTNKMRRDVIHYLNQKGGSGARFIELKSQLHVGTGQLLWHLKVLEEFKVINLVKINRCKIYYLREFSIDQDRLKHELVLKNKNTQIIIQLLLLNFEMTIGDIVGIVKFSRTTVTNHLKKLKRNGLIKKERRENIGFFSIINPEYVKEILSDINNQSKLSNQHKFQEYSSGDWKKQYSIYKNEYKNI